MPRSTYLLALAATVFALAAAGCGTDGPLIDAGGKLRDLKIVPTSPATGSANPQEGGAQEFARLRDAVARNYAQNTNLRADVTVFIRNIQKGNVESAKLDYWFQKPNATALKIKEHSKAGAAGTKIVWMGGDKVGIKTKFLGFWLKTSLAESDDRIKDARGSRISDTAVPRMMQTILDPQAQVAIYGRGEYKGRPVVQLSLKSRFMLARVESERITIDTGNFLPVVREMYEAGPKLTYRMQLEGIKLNSHEPKAFELDD